MAMRVGDYSLGPIIGSGAHSSVRRCEHRPSNTQWVAKVVSKQHAGVDQVVRAEILTLRRVTHPNIVMFREILESGRNFYIILEAVEGGDMCDRLIRNQDGLPEHVAARYFSQIVAGLMACHRQGVAHRDLKPENLLITTKDQVKLSDFGLSRLHRESRMSAHPQEYAQTLTGTLNYAAPEVLDGTQYDAFLADLWSLGCILYVMLCGRFPFGSDPPEELRRRISNMLVTPLPARISDDARDLVTRLLRRDPRERLSLDAVAAHPFLANRAATPPLSQSSELWGQTVPDDIVHSMDMTTEDDLSRGSPNRAGQLREMPVSVNAA